MGQKLRAALPSTVPFMALTATATAKVKAQICERLQLRTPLTARLPMDRPEISYEVALCEVLDDRSSSALGDLFNRLVGPAARHAGQCGIIYCATREGTVALAKQLNDAGVSALAYHAGLSAQIRKENQHKFISGEALVMVATTAFGMGVNKRDVRFVFHWSVPQSFEAFAQEVGRAARDGLPGASVVYFDRKDARTARFLIEKETTDDERKARKLAAFELVHEFCKAKAGCRRKALLSHFGELPLRPTQRDGIMRVCCDACSYPQRVAADAAALELIAARGSEAVRASIKGGGSDEVGEARGARKRVRADPHDTGLVDDEEDSDDEHRGGGGGAGSSGNGCSSSFAGSIRPLLAGARAGKKVKKPTQASRDALASRLASLEELEAADEEETKRAGGAARLRAALR